MTLNALAAEILDINRSNGWNVPVPDDWVLAAPGQECTFKGATAMYKIPTCLNLITSEVSEATEEHRKGHDLQKFAEELVDVLIRTLELAGGLGVDIDAAMATKLAKNRTRGHRHGGRLV